MTQTLPIVSHDTLADLLGPDALVTLCFAQADAGGRARRLPLLQQADDGRLWFCLWFCDRPASGGRASTGARV